LGPPSPKHFVQGGPHLASLALRDDCPQPGSK
jgi:hypothetical protein